MQGKKHSALMLFSGYIIAAQPESFPLGDLLDRDF
jgi:hypothetical protein